jgi:hypothetical protein
MPKDNLVQRLIAFLKRPDALDYQKREPVRNPYDDYEPQEIRHTADEYLSTVDRLSHASQSVDEAPIAYGRNRAPVYASRLDALVMRALKQFNAQVGFVIRYDEQGRMRYLTGRDLQGRYVSPADVNPDRRAVFLTLDSGQSQLFVRPVGSSAMAVLCGPLRVNDQVVGVFYLDNPARSRLHRGVFDVFCDQVARMLSEGVVQT